MAAPNIMAATSIYGKNAKLAVTTSLTAILSNTTASGKVFKVNLLNVANVDGSASADITATIYNGSTDTRLAFTVAVPADNAISILDKPLYLQEGESIRLQASTAGDLEAVASYEEIS